MSARKEVNKWEIWIEEIQEMRSLDPIVLFTSTKWLVLDVKTLSPIFLSDNVVIPEFTFMQGKWCVAVSGYVSD